MTIFRLTSIFQHHRENIDKDYDILINIFFLQNQLLFLCYFYRLHVHLITFVRTGSVYFVYVFAVEIRMCSTFSPRGLRRTITL